MSRTKELPQNFLPIKKDVSKLENTFWYNKQKENQTRDESKENVGLLYLLMSDFANFAELKQYSWGDKLLSIMGTESDWQIKFGEYGKKLVYNREGNWIEILDMTHEDFVQYDKESNEKFLANKGSK